MPLDAPQLSEQANAAKRQRADVRRGLAVYLCVRDCMRARRGCCLVCRLPLRHLLPPAVCLPRRRCSLSPRACHGCARAVPSPRAPSCHRTTLPHPPYRHPRQRRVSGRPLHVSRRCWVTRSVA
jgi:hypothetical protein